MVINVAGIETTFPRTQVAQVNVVLSLAEEFQQKRAAIEDTNYDARFDLARWVYDHKTAEAYKLSLAELNSIIDAKPDYQKAKLLRDVVMERMKLEPTTGTKPEPTTPTGPKPEPTPTEPGEKNLLTKDQINLVRVYEVQLANKPRIAQLAPDVVAELYKNYRDNPNFQPYLGRDGEAKFKNLQGYEQLKVLFDLRARELYEKVQIREEPETLQDFRTKIHPTYVVRYCGRCHTQGKAPGLDLYTQSVSSDPVIYTNLLILRRTMVGPFSIINKTEPAKSTFLQFGLPEKDAITPHPKVPGWRQFFTGPSDPRYTEMVKWIGSLYGESQDYPIDFSPPVPPKPATPPAAPAPEKTSAVPDGK
ncbi:MAG: hypothetical protein GC162_17505 [Planctomycetes bacterium]|nr:hypothetical protein [Planctomycetota bacterium]